MPFGKVLTVADAEALGIPTETRVVKKQPFCVHRGDNCIWPECTRPGGAKCQPAKEK